MTTLPSAGPLLTQTAQGTSSTPSSNNGSNGNGNPAADLLAEIARKQKLEQDKIKWASHFNDEYRKCKNARNVFERQWYINLAFVSGRQYVVPMESPISGTRLTVPRIPPHRVRMVVNLTRKAVIKECSKLTMSKPIPTVMPATTENEDLTAAQVSEAILKARFAEPDFSDEYRMWAWWGVVCGTSYMKAFYDSKGVDFQNMVLPPRPQMLGPDGSPMPVPDEFISSIPELKRLLETPVPAQGKIEIEHLSPFHLFVPDLMVTSLDKQPYVIEVRTKHPEWVKKRYGFVPTCDSRAQSSIMESAFLTTRSTEEHLDAVIVKEVWIKPNFHPDFPEGGWLTIINDKVVDCREQWPLPFPEYPYYKYSGLPSGGFYTDSRVVDLIPVQKEYNKKRSQAIEIMNTMGKPKFIYQSGSINMRRVSSEPGQGIEYKAGYMPPQELRGSEVPQSIFNEIQQLRSEFDDISGQHEISEGDTPSGVTSGTAISYLQEQDETGLTYQVAAIEHAIQLLGTHYLKYVTTFWTDDRIIRITGRNNSFESIHWKKSAAQGNTDVRVQTGSALPFSKAAKQALITEMMQNGFLDPAVGLEILDMGTFDKAMEEFLVDKRQAMRENIKHQDLPDNVAKVLLNPPPGSKQTPQGEIVDPNGMPWRAQAPIPVQSWDNHELHIQYHNLYRKTQEFEQLTEFQKQAMELHVQTHQQSLMAGVVNQQGEPLDQMASDSQGMQQDQQFGQQQQQQQNDHAVQMEKTKQDGQQQLEKTRAQNRPTPSANGSASG